MKFNVFFWINGWCRIHSNSILKISSMIGCDLLVSCGCEMGNNLLRWYHDEKLEIFFSIFFVQNSDSTSEEAKTFAFSTAYRRLSWTSDKNKEKQKVDFYPKSIFSFGYCSVICKDFLLIFRHCQFEYPEIMNKYEFYECQVEKKVLSKKK